MFPEASVAVRRTFRGGPARVGAALFLAALVADLVALALDGGRLLAVGFWLGRAALAWIALTVLATGLPLGDDRPRVRRPTAATGLLLGALATWIRAHPGIPPDPPIVGANLLALLLFLWASRPPAAVGRGAAPDQPQTPRSSSRS